VIKRRLLVIVVHFLSFAVADSTTPVLKLILQIPGVLLLQILIEMAFVVRVCKGGMHCLQTWLVTKYWIFLIAPIFLYQTFKCFKCFGG
jgi:hypothetical protein